MEEQFDGLEQIVEDEILEENPEYQYECLEENLENQDECEPNFEDPYKRQLNESEIKNAIDRAKEEEDDLKDDEPDIMDIESEFANARVSPSKRPFIIRHRRRW